MLPRGINAGVLGGYLQTREGIVTKSVALANHCVANLQQGKPTANVTY